MYLTYAASFLSVVEFPGLFWLSLEQNREFIMCSRHELPRQCGKFERVCMRMESRGKCMAVQGKLDQMTRKPIARRRPNTDPPSSLFTEFIFLLIIYVGVNDTFPFVLFSFHPFSLLQFFLFFIWVNFFKRIHDIFLRYIRRIWDSLMKELGTFKQLPALTLKI